MRPGPPHPPRPGYPPGPVTWVATAPPGAYRRRRTPVSFPYAGPPAYPVPPRWGFPHLTWRWPTSVPGARDQPADPLTRVRELARLLTLVLWIVAGLTALAGIGEGWRYGLLLASRHGALSATVVDVSDTLVVGPFLAYLVAVTAAAGLFLMWLQRTREVAARAAGYRPSRPFWQIVVGFLPLLNLVVPGATLAELEHAALRRPAEVRPTPSRPLLAWWLTWAAGWVLVGLAAVWSLRGTVQAMADGVLLHAAADFVAAAVAVLTWRFVRRTTRLLGADDLSGLAGLPRVISVADAPPPELRRTRPAAAAR